MIFEICFLFMVLSTTGAIKTEKSLSILVKNKAVEVSQSILTERVTLVANLNISLTSLKTSFITLSNAYKKYTDLGFFSDPALKKEYQQAIDVGKGQFARTSEIIQDLFNGLDQKLIQTPESSCVFFMATLNDTTIISETQFLTAKIAKVLGTWPIAEVKGENLALLERFIQSYNSISTGWYFTVQRQASNWNTLLSGKFPEELLAQLEQISCLERTKYETVEVLGCTEGKQGLVCELNVQIPNSQQTYMTYTEVNYEGAQIAVPKPNYRFAQSSEGAELVWLDCKMEDLKSSDAIHCTEQEIESLCRHALQHDDVDKILSNCNFTLVTPELISHLHDDGILIQGEEIMLLEDGKNIFSKPPLIIYTNLELIVLKDHKESKIIANTHTDNPRIIETKLSEDQISSMVSKAWWGDIAREMGWEDYVEYVGLALELILLPLTLLGIVLGLRGKCTKSRHEENPRKRNYRESKAMLKSKN